ncbi:multiheme c-type cytochrome [Hydrogenimonas sp.]|uniref:multiheme c-type cytochrome n=1 Tax=Hydrogenimonas sp. TaxID=2231112 RepID=UPI00260320E1|nr:multiheme c-type cytochrome [Hydrogenimonas sp.]
MSRLLILAAFATLSFAAGHFTGSNVCKKCHPIIYREYSESMHKRSSIANDPVHRAIWEKHPLKAGEKYTCAVCHTPSDERVMNALAAGKPAMPEPDNVQTHEPISCAYCHRIKSIERHTKQNRNILNGKPKYYYAAKRGKTEKEVVKFHETSSFFGLSHSIEGSPFHTIDYSNELFNSGKNCLGCHDHKQNGKGFTICSLDLKERQNEKQNCITCHMPQVPGSYSTIVKSKTHAYHGFAGVHLRPELLADSILLAASEENGMLKVTIENRANHRLFSHPLRLGMLRIAIRRGGDTIQSDPVAFYTILGHDGKPAMPWMADTILKAHTIEAYETKTLETGMHLQKGDRVTVTLGYHIVNPNAAEKLGIEEKKASEFRVLKSQTFFF